MSGLVWDLQMHPEHLETLFRKTSGGYRPEQQKEGCMGPGIQKPPELRSLCLIMFNFLPWLSFGV